MKSRIYTAVCAVLVFLVGCGQSSKTGVPDPVEPSVRLSFLASAPAEFSELGAIHPTAKPGDNVTVRGVVGGVLEPFVDGYAAFVMADDSMQFCTEIPGDTCPTPWDACCEDPDKLAENRATVMFTGADGKALSGGIKGVGGLKELSEVIILGKVAEISSPGNLIIAADSLYLATN